MKFIVTLAKIESANRKNPFAKNVRGFQSPSGNPYRGRKRLLDCSRNPTLTDRCNTPRPRPTKPNVILLPLRPLFVPAASGQNQARPAVSSPYYNHKEPQGSGGISLRTREAPDDMSFRISFLGVSCDFASC
jgi:hypothetical protein